MSHPVHDLASASMPGRLPSSFLPRWLLVAAAVALIGVGIDLFQGPPASALPARAAQDHAVAALPIDHSVVARLVDEPALEPGASVASYDTPADDAGMQASAPPLPQAVDDLELEPGASIAAYER